MGLFGSVFVVSVFGGVLITPVIVKVLVNHEINPQNLFLRTINNTQDSEAPALELAYCGIAAGTGIVVGLISGLFAICIRHANDDFSDEKLFHVHDYGLNDQHLHRHEEGNDTKPHSAGHLKA